MKPVHVLVLSGFGLNCDHETLYAFELAGAAATRVHINSLIDGSSRLEDFDILVFIGGFSWGDDHGAGVIQAVRMKSTLGEKLIDFVATGKLILGICNGFQTLVNLGLLPGFDHDYRRRCVALIDNDCGNFRNQWVHLMVNSASPCVFTRGLQRLELPVRHGEGKFFAEPATISRLVENNQVVIRYADTQGRPAQARFPDNPNGSEDDIAGICDPTGRIFGLMPHPEAYNHWTNHPDWTRHRESWIRQGKTTGPRPTPGIQLLQNAVSYIRES
jgi:phosphoribosylformylglycinamidine synthase I